MSSKGQSLIEAVVVTLLLCSLFTLLLKMSYLLWADFIVDRETHRLVLCGLENRKVPICERHSLSQLKRLLHWGDTYGLNLNVTKVSQGTYVARALIDYRIFQSHI